MIETKKYADITEELELSFALVNTAQQTLCDLDKSVAELSLLVEGLKLQSAKISDL